MFKDLVRLGTLTSISSNSNYTIQLPLKGALTDLVAVSLNSSGVPVAIGTEVDTLSVRAGDEGEIVKPLSPAHLAYLALYKFGATGFTATTGVTPLYTAPRNPNELQRLAYMIGTKGLSSLSVEVDTGTISGVAQIEIWGRRLTGADFDQMGIGRHVRISKETISTTGTGEKAFDQVPYIRERGVRLMAVHMANASGTGAITKLAVEVNEVPQHFAHVAYHQAIQKLQGRSPQANYYAADFSLDNTADIGLPMGDASRVNVRAYWSVDPAADHDMIIETLHGIDEAVGV